MLSQALFPTFLSDSTAKTQEPGDAFFANVPIPLRGRCPSPGTHCPRSRGGRLPLKRLLACRYVPACSNQPVRTGTLQTVKRQVRGLEDPNQELPRTANAAQQADSRTFKLRRSNRQATQHAHRFTEHRRKTRHPGTDVVSRDRDTDVDKRGSVTVSSFLIRESAA